MTLRPPQLLRELVRTYVRAQRKQATCGDGGSTVRCHVLTELLRQEGLTQQALVERLGLDKGWISRAVEALVAQGTVSKQTNPLDLRSVTLTLTPAGLVRAAALESALNGHADQLLARIPQGRRAQVRKSLQLLLEAVSGQPGDGEGSGGLGVEWRPARLLDWPAIVRLLSGAGLPLDGARDHIDHFLVGDCGGEVIGAGGLELYGDCALLRSIVVDQAMRGRGCGQQLVERLIHRCEYLGVRNLYLLTTTAQSYFADLGFAVLDRADVPQSIRESAEFQGACPAQAISMVLQLRRS